MYRQKNKVAPIKQNYGIEEKLLSFAPNNFRVFPSPKKKYNIDYTTENSPPSNYNNITLYSY